jgi:hypothetical protein
MPAVAVVLADQHIQRLDPSGNALPIHQDGHVTHQRRM